jgi:hypothetical protein
VSKPSAFLGSRDKKSTREGARMTLRVLLCGHLTKLGLILQHLTKPRRYLVLAKRLLITQSSQGSWKKQSGWRVARPRLNRFRVTTRLPELTLPVEHMPTLANSSAILPVPGFPEGVHMHWETQRCVVWNDREHASEEHELVYEISWVAELGLWRRFLRSQRKVKS